jgi:hypothetical protein
MPAQQQMQELPPPPEGFRPNVGMCVFHPQKGVFAALRLDTPGKAWQMPQGMVPAQRQCRQQTPLGCTHTGRRVSGEASPLGLCTRFFGGLQAVNMTGHRTSYRLQPKMVPILCLLSCARVCLRWHRPW